MNNQEELVLFRTLKDLMLANKKTVPFRFRSISDLTDIIERKEKK